MDIVIDIGNTRSKLGVFLNGGIHKLFQVEGNVNLNDPIFSDLIPDRIIVSSGNQFLPEFPETWQHSEVLIFNSATRLPIVNDYETPETLGKDRIAAAVGAHFLYPGRNMLSIDCGTCITYDFVDAEGVYRGGSISPGLSMRFAAMNHYAPVLPLETPDMEAKLPGRNTRDALRTGVQNGIIFEMNGQIEFYASNWANLGVVLCGGDAPFFVNRLNYMIFANQNLVLIGLHQILDYNVKKAK